MSNHMDHLNAICNMKDRFIEWTKEELGKGQAHARSHLLHQGYLASCGTRDEGTHEV